MDFINRCFFEDINFRVTFISGDENQIKNDFYVSYLPFPSSLRSSFIGFFRKLEGKKQHDRVYILLC